MAAKKAGGDEASIPLFLAQKADSSSTWKAIESLIVDMIEKSLTLTVDYDKSIDDLVATFGKGIDERITEANFLRQEHERGQKAVSFRLYHHGERDALSLVPEILQVAEDAGVIEHMRRDQCRPATVREVLAFGQVNPCIEKHFKIAAIESPFIGPQGHRRYVCLKGRAGKCLPCLTWFTNSTNYKEYLFLARKVS